MKLKRSYLSLFALTVCLISACTDYYKNDYKDNSPTSGKLKVYYDEGLQLHVKNQVETFHANYPNAEVQLAQVTEAEAVMALFNDSCEAIVIERGLTDTERSAFASKHYKTNFTQVATTGVALIANKQSALKTLRLGALTQLLKFGTAIQDSTGKEFKPLVLFDKPNSGVLHYMLDTILKTRQLAPVCKIFNSTLESIEYVATHPEAIALIDFSWLSDQDDDLFKKYVSSIKFIPLAADTSAVFAFPDQSNFKLGIYPLARPVLVMRKVGDFTLAKGFESWMAGAKGQLIFLKQGLLPSRQAERNIHINLEGVKEQ
jgi:phosphate transport system substrate-binding protein